MKLYRHSIATNDLYHGFHTLAGRLTRKINETGTLSTWINWPVFESLLSHLTQFFAEST
jgi:hypothetical protein